MNIGAVTDENEIRNALRTAQWDAQKTPHVFEAVDAFDAVKPFLVARDEEIARLRAELERMTKESL